jgi:TIGR03009 family protein
MSVQDAFTCRAAVSGAVILFAIAQSTAAQQQPRVAVPSRPQPAAGAPGNRPAAIPNGQPPAAPQGEAPSYIAAPPSSGQQPNAAQSAGGQMPAGQGPNAQPPRAAAPQPRAPMIQQPGAPNGQQPGVATEGAPTGPIPRTPGAGAIRPVQHQQPILPPLSPEQEAELDRVLLAWEQESDKVKTLSANFTVWEYGDPYSTTKSTGGPPKMKREAKGEIHFAAPDKGSFRELEGGDERWMCDGTAIYEFKAKEKVLHEYKLPPELQGKSISKGPLPFVFGAKADTMKQRYAMRIVTPADAKNQIWIEAWPRSQQDAANFNHVQVILDTKATEGGPHVQHRPHPGGAAFQGLRLCQH